MSDNLQLHRSAPLLRLPREQPMEQIVNLHIEKLPEGVYLATSDDVPGLVAQGRTIQETLEIARDVAKKLLEAQAERTGKKRTGKLKLVPVKTRFEYPLIVSA
jgi:predicted RNase H-like HicB family nuclease